MKETKEFYDYILFSIPSDTDSYISTSLTATVVFVDLNGILFTDMTSLTKLRTRFLCTNGSLEKRDLCEGIPFVVHDAVVVIWTAQTVNGTSRVFSEVVFIICT